MLTEGKAIKKNDSDVNEAPQSKLADVAQPVKVETTSTTNVSDTNTSDDNDAVAKVSEPPSPSSAEPEEEAEDDEEIFMQALEIKEEKAIEKSIKNHTTLAQDSNDAPTLLRASLNKEEDEKQQAKNAKLEEKEEEKDEIKNQFVERGNQLDFLLSKASEYSNFIANDLKELETIKAAEAEAAAAAASSKKRKRKDTVNVGSGKSAIFTQPSNLAKGCILKDYQLEGVRWLTSLYENGMSGILADEMGLGKTIQVIALIAHLRMKDVSGPFLIVVPLATLPNWIREFEKWLPESNVCRYHGNAHDRGALWSGPLHPRGKRSPNFPIIVTSYEISIKDARKLSKLGEYTFMVVDEGHRLKNHRCTLLQSLKSIPSSNRLLLSGTPIQNNLDELWSLLNFVNPQIFDDLSVFQSWFGFRDIGFRKTNNYSDEEQILLEQRTNSTVSKLHEILRPFLLRRVKKDVLSDLPPKREVVVYAGMSKLQVGYFHCIEQGTLRSMLATNGIDVSGKNVSQTNMQMNHRKNSNHPFLFGEPLDAATGVYIGSAHPELLIRASGKFALLDRMLKRLFTDKHQVLIFSQMTAVLNVMEDYLHYRNWKYCRIDGSTQIDDRQRQMDDFNSDSSDIFIFLLSTRAGGLGINLTAADTCIIFDSDWNPHQDSQAMDRCHRIGQTRPVGVYRLLTLGSVDIEMMEKQMSKKKLERMTVVGGDFRKAGLRSQGEFSQEQLSNLLTDDIKDLQQKTLVAGKSQNIGIEDEEFENIMDRESLFSKDLKKEGKMYDVVEQSNVGLLGAVQG